MLTWVLLAIVISGAASQRQVLADEVRRSTDVTWLERLCTELSFAEAEYDARGRNTAGVKGVRQAAYVRLGELATAESLAAARRVRSVHQRQSVLPRPLVPQRWHYHPAPHMGDWRWHPGNQIRLSDGRGATAFVLSAYRPPALFIATATQGRWSRPRLVPFAVTPHVTVSLVEVGPGRLRAELAALKSPNTPPLQVPVVPDAVEFDLALVERDTDGDGWTDVEENWVGLNWRSTDSDRDGIDDGHDSTPLPGRQAQIMPEESAIIGHAVFAMFGLSGSSYALFVDEGSASLNVTDLPTPVFYRASAGGVRVTWKILSRTETEATVEITDYVGPLAASGNELKLRRIGEEGYVIAVHMKWIS